MASLDEPVHRTNLRHEVRRRVRAAVLSGEFAPHERITEGSLAERLGTSRAPVREVLRELEQEGLVESLGLRGYQVKSLSLIDVRELFQVRMALERLAVGLLPETRTKLIDELNEIVTQMRAAAGEPNQLDELDTRFHETIVGAAGNAHLLRTWRSMRDQLRLAIHMTNTSFGSRAGTADSHRRLVEALEQGDVSVAQRAIEDHIEKGIERLAQQWQEAR